MNKSFIILLLLIVSFSGKSQGLIINEFSNGPSGLKEWVELLVIGDPASPNSPVNLTGWILDDNGGNFEGSISGVGIAQGHIKFSSSFNAVPPGSLIVIYNETDKSTNIPSDDPSDSNNDGVYILPGNHASLLACTNVPTIGNFNYSCSGTSSIWNYAGMRNGGDAVQIIDPSSILFHGFCYGDITSPFPLFPSNVSTWNIGSGSTGLAYAFDCGDWEIKASFNEINESVSTPGASNTSNNDAFITKLKNGTFDYANLDANCTTPPVVIIPDTVLPLPKIVIPNVFSPNKDGKNDLFTIDSLNYYKTKELTIYNRWGLIVYDNKNYSNDWNGKTKDGNPVASGTYYYILNIGEQKKRTGFLNVFK